MDSNLFTSLVLPGTLRCGSWCAPLCPAFVPLLLWPSVPRIVSTLVFQAMLLILLGFLDCHLLYEACLDSYCSLPRIDLAFPFLAEHNEENLTILFCLYIRLTFTVVFLKAEVRSNSYVCFQCIHTKYSWISEWITEWVNEWLWNYKSLDRL